MKAEYIVFGMLMATLAACGHRPEKKGKEDRKDSATVAGAGMRRREAAAVEIRLTGMQVKAIGLQTGNVEQRNLRSSLKVNGKLVLLPQSQAQVSSLSGGIIKSIWVKEGDFVKQGWVLATLQNNEFVQWQQDYLENKSQLHYLEAEYARQKSLRQDSINAEKTFHQVENELGVARARQAGIRTKLQMAAYPAGGLRARGVRSENRVGAPINGCIHHVKVKIGENAGGKSLLFDLVDIPDFPLDFTVFEKDVHKLAVGQKVLF